MQQQHYQIPCSKPAAQCRRTACKLFNSFVNDMTQSSQPARSVLHKSHGCRCSGEGLCKSDLAARAPGTCHFKINHAVLPLLGERNAVSSFRLACSLSMMHWSCQRLSVKSGKCILLEHRDTESESAVHLTQEQGLAPTTLILCAWKCLAPYPTWSVPNASSWATTPL